jgi:hypothetical protein
VSHPIHWVGLRIEGQNMAHSHTNDSSSEALHAAIEQAQQLSDRQDRHSTRSWEAAKHVGDLSALAMVALARPDRRAA